MKGRCEELARMLEASVSRNRCDAILLSGGLDSSILASIARPKYAVSCSLDHGSPDTPFAKEVAERFCSSYADERISFENMRGLVEKIVQIFRTFDPIEIRNSAVALAGMQRAKTDGHLEIMTGDGGDELFAGYNYLLRYHSNTEKLDSEIRRLWKVMHFSSEKIGERIGMKVNAPYLDKEFMEYAKSIPLEEKIGEHRGGLWGKLVLRSCYEQALGPKIAWRAKLAQEQGAGTDRYQDYINSTLDDLVFSNKSKMALDEGVVLRSKEHLHYYAIFRSYFPPPRADEQTQSCKHRCPACNACMQPDGRFCRTCGGYPVTPMNLP